MTRLQAPHRRSRPARLVLAVLALWALLGGGSIAQAHVHPSHAIARDARHGMATLAMPEADCALCDALAAFEPLLPGEAPAAAPGPITAATRPAMPVAAYALPDAHGHGWRSRAPPFRIPTI